MFRFFLYFRYLTLVMENNFKTKEMLNNSKTEEMLQSIRRLLLDDDQVMPLSKCPLVHGELCPMLSLRLMRAI